MRGGATVGEIASSAREAARLFDTLGIDYACHGNLTLGDACADLHLDPAEVERALRRLEPEVRSDAAGKSVTEVVHELTAAEFPAIRYRLARVATDVIEICAGLRANRRTADLLHDAFEKVAGGITDHISREESDLMPRLARLTASDRADVARQLATFIAEHHAIMNSLRALKAAVAEAEKVRPACAHLRAALRDLESELRQHMHIENNVLFPRLLPKSALLTPLARE